jgi:hypothetical protein
MNKCCCETTVRGLFQTVKAPFSEPLTKGTVDEICRQVDLYRDNSADNRIRQEQFLTNILIDRKGARSTLLHSAYFEILQKIGYGHENPNLAMWTHKHTNSQISADMLENRK